MLRAELARDWAFLLPLFGEAVLTFALLPHFMLCHCLALAFPFLGLCRARGSLASSCLPIPRHRAVPGVRPRGRAGLWWGLKVRLHNARRVGAGGEVACVGEIRLPKAPAFPPSFLGVPGLTAPRKEKDRDGTFRKTCIAKATGAMKGGEGGFWPARAAGAWLHHWGEGCAQFPLYADGQKAFRQ